MTLEWKSQIFKLFFSFFVFSVPSDLLSSGYVERHLSEKGKTVVTNVRFCKSSLLMLTHTIQLCALRMETTLALYCPGLGIKGKLQFISIWRIFHGCGHCDSMGQVNFRLATSVVEIQGNEDSRKTTYQIKIQEPPTAFQKYMMFTWIISDICLWVWPKVNTESSCLERLLGMYTSRTTCSLT